VTIFLLFFPSLRLCSAIRLNLTFAALSLTFIILLKAFLVFHAGGVIIGLPCGQGQTSRIWKVQCVLAKLGKEMLFSDERAFVGRKEIRALLKTPTWEARKN